jgi:hypothetical protein
MTENKHADGFGAAVLTIDIGFGEISTLGSTSADAMIVPAY